LDKLKVVILETNVGKFLTDSRIFSENNPPILIGTVVFKERNFTLEYAFSGS
jgi:hypothetical protein